ncbi:MAG TPA: AAA family ATPase, partial [Candidatus Dormibacteraeota bacterium]|nr:AAA family ATPase [Candidatus Dormibacteraeota bacterium]
MLRALRIENYALIRGAEVHFDAALTVFTGETGSGKSMLLGALAFVCGLRNDLESVGGRGGTTRVTLEFDVDASALAWLREHDIEIEPNEEATLEREILRSGKSGARICGRSASVAMLRELGERVVDFVGQHEAQRLVERAFQRALLDRFGGTATLRASAALATAYEARAKARGDVALIAERRRTHAERAKFLNDALAALDDLQPQPDEYARMRERRTMLANGERIAGSLRTAHDALLGEERSADRSFGVADTALRSLVGLAPNVAGLATRVEALQGETADLGSELLGALER